MGQIKDSRAEFNARALIVETERLLAKCNQLDEFDVYIEWYDDEPDNMELWLRDRSDDSRIGPLGLDLEEKRLTHYTPNSIMSNM